MSEKITLNVTRDWHGRFARSGAVESLEHRKFKRLLKNTFLAIFMATCFMAAWLILPGQFVVYSGSATVALLFLLLFEKE